MTQAQLAFTSAGPVLIGFYGFDGGRKQRSEIRIASSGKIAEKKVLRVQEHPQEKSSARTRAENGMRRGRDKMRWEGAAAAILACMKFEGGAFPISLNFGHFRNDFAFIFKPEILC